MAARLARLARHVTPVAAPAPCAATERRTSGSAGGSPTAHSPANLDRRYLDDEDDGEMDLHDDYFPVEMSESEKFMFDLQGVRPLARCRHPTPPHAPGAPAWHLSAHPGDAAVPHRPRVSQPGRGRRAEYRLRRQLGQAARVRPRVVRPVWRDAHVAPSALPALQGPARAQEAAPLPQHDARAWLPLRALSFTTFSKPATFLLSELSIVQMHTQPRPVLGRTTARS